MTIKSGRPYTSMDRCRWKQRPLLQRELGKERQWLERRGNGRKLLRSDRETRGRHPQVREIERARPFSAALSDPRDAFRKKRLLCPDLAQVLFIQVALFCHVR